MISYCHLDETRCGWILQRPTNNIKNRHIDLGFIVCCYNATKWTVGLTFMAFIFIGSLTIIKSMLSTNNPPSLDNYTVPLRAHFYSSTAKNASAHTSFFNLNFIYFYFMWKAYNIFSLFSEARIGLRKWHIMARRF